MTTEVITVKPNDTMLRVHEIFGAKDIHHLPVVDPKGVVVGMMSTSDYLSVANAFPLFRPDKREEAIVTVLAQAERVCADWVGAA